MISFGNTKVICTASVEEKVPHFIKGQGSGWLTAEYSMLPRATNVRTVRDSARGKLNGRGSEISRLIGRSLRAALDMGALGERTVHIDCDVIQADGGTRTASITGAFVALFDAARWLRERGMISTQPIIAQVAAVSVGKLDDAMLLDLCYEEDRSAAVDANVVMNHKGDFIELQATGENGVLSRSELGSMLELAENGIKRLFDEQTEALCITDEEKFICHPLT